VLGAPISRASISPSDAWSTPPAFRQALARFHPWDATHGVDLAATLRVRDLGDVVGDRDDRDARAAHDRIRDAVADASAIAPLVVVIGGDNSLTRPAMQGMMRTSGGEWGLLTFDAHHDCRPVDGASRNGTPVRELIEGGLPGERVAQIGINAFANAGDQARWAAAHGVHVFLVDEVRRAGMATVVAAALDSLRRAGATALYLDVDVDVVDRGFAPACPASLPGGLLPHELLEGVERAVRDERVRAADFTEVDAKADVAACTVRLLAAAFVNLCSSVARRRGVASIA
jgi:formiminoglutamase